MREIIISDVRVTTEDQYYRRFSMGRDSQEHIVEQLRVYGITPHTHPKAIDLFAGDGSVAAILKSVGWSEKNISCVDKYFTPTPLVEGVTWYYWNLAELGAAIVFHDEIPADIQRLRNTFDIAISRFGDTEEIALQGLGLTLCTYFVRRNGYVLTTDPPATRIITKLP